MTDSATKNKLLEMDLYKLFDVEETCPIEQIKKAYRKKALELHPDKNLENKEEAERKFVELGKAFEILADKSARAAYDAVRKQKREKAKRDEQLDGKRRKMKEELESREKAAKEKFEQQTAHMRKNKEEERLNEEIERLRKEGSKLLEEEMNFINEQVRLEKKRTLNEEQKVKKEAHNSKIVPRIKISWPKEASNLIDDKLLNEIFSRYGEIDILVISKKTNAILEYKNYTSAIECINDERNLNEQYLISLKCLDSTIAPTSKSQSENDTTCSNLATDNITSNEKRLPATNNIDFSNFEEMEMAILKKLKSA